MVAVVLVAADQASKFWIINGLKLPELRTIELLPFLNFTMVWNEGISMGLITGDEVGKWALIALTFAITLWLVNWLRTTTEKLEAYALAMIIGGAVGNVIDRFIHGAVVDFVHLHAWGYNFYVFNLADSAISIGAVLLLLDGLLAGRKSPKNASKNPEADAQ